MIVETSGSFPDVPFGSHFLVETKYEVIPIGENKVSIQNNIAFNFLKKTILEGNNPNINFPKLKFFE